MGRFPKVSVRGIRNEVFNQRTSAKIILTNSLTSRVVLLRAGVRTLSNLAHEGVGCRVDSFVVRGR